MKTRILPSSDGIAAEAVHGFFTRRANAPVLPQTGSHVWPSLDGECPDENVRAINDGLHAAYLPEMLVEHPSVSIGSPSPSDRLDDPTGRYSVDEPATKTSSAGTADSTSSAAMMVRHCQHRAGR
jgi:hypothetical protein